MALAPASCEEKLLGKPIPSGAAFPPLPHPARLHPPRPRGPPAGPPAPRWMSQKRKILGRALLKPPQAKRLQRGWTGNSSSNRRGRPGAKSPPSSRPRPSLHPAPPERRHRTCAQPQVGRKRPSPHRSSRAGKRSSPRAEAEGCSLPAHTRTLALAGSWPSALAGQTSQKLNKGRTLSLPFPSLP